MKFLHTIQESVDIGILTTWNCLIKHTITNKSLHILLHIINEYLKEEERKRNQNSQCSSFPIFWSNPIK